MSEDFKDIPGEVGDIKEKVTKFLGEYMFFFIALLVCVVYMLSDLFNIAETGKTIKEILADSAVTFFMGILISKLLGLQGLLRGEKSEQYLDALKNHKDLVDKVKPNLGTLIEWCKVQNKEKIIELRTSILNNAELEYSKYINGEYKTAELTKRQLLAIHKARALKITPLSASGLIGGETPSLDPFYLGKTKNQSLRKDARKTVISKVALAVLFGYFGVKATQDVSTASLIWRAVQVVIFIAGGFTKYWNNYYLMYNDMPIRMQKQDSYLEVFKVWEEEHHDEIKAREEQKLREVKENEEDGHTGQVQTISRDSEKEEVQESDNRGCVEESVRTSEERGNTEYSI